MRNSALTFTVIGILFVGVLGAVIWYASVGTSVAEAEILSRRGLHWHPELTVYIKREKQIIPTDIGLGVVHNPVHTHDASGVVHLEMEGLVRKEDTTLGEFFRVWNKTFSDFGTTTPRMLVNGAENTELLAYPMKDKDKIELYFD